MRTILIALLMTLSTQVWAEDKKYSSKECEGISDTIDYLLSLTPRMWDKLAKQPNNEKIALELSWAVEMAANYTVIYTAFCKDND
jgi:hypothetical protein